MEIKILDRKENPLLKRQEISFAVVHTTAATPKLADVRGKLAALTGGDEKLVIVDGLGTRAGTNTAKGFAKIYKNAAEMNSLESKKIVNKQFGIKEVKAAAKPEEKKEAKASA